MGYPDLDCVCVAPNDNPWPYYIPTDTDKGDKTTFLRSLGAKLARHNVFITNLDSFIVDAPCQRDENGRPTGLNFPYSCSSDTYLSVSSQPLEMEETPVRMPIWIDKKFNDEAYFNCNSRHLKDCRPDIDCTLNIKFEYLSDEDHPFVVTGSYVCFNNNPMLENRTLYFPTRQFKIDIDQESWDEMNAMYKSLFPFAL
jgi:hypothetical protein